MYKIILSIVLTLFFVSCINNDSFTYLHDSNKSAFHPLKISNISLSNGYYPLYLTNNTPFYTVSNGNGTLFIGVVSADGTSREIAVLEENNNSNFDVIASMDAGYIVAGQQNPEDLYLYKIESNLTVTKVSSIKIDSPSSTTITRSNVLDISNDTIAVSELRTYLDANTAQFYDDNKVVILNIEKNATMSIVQEIREASSVNTFGASLVLDDNTLAISDTDANIYIYQKEDNGTFTKTDTFIAEDVSRYNAVTLSLHKNHLLVNVRRSNRVYLYELQNGKVKSFQEIIAENGFKFVDGGQAIYNNTILLNTSGTSSRNTTGLSVYTLSVLASQTIITKHSDLNTSNNIASFHGTQFIIPSDTRESFYIYDTNPLNEIYIYNDKNPKVTLDEEELYSINSVDANSPNGELEYSLSGIDATYFKLIGESLYPIAPLDYENPLDSNMDNNYILEIEIVDAKNRKATLNVNIEVVNREYLLKERIVVNNSTQNTYLGKSLFIDARDVVIGAEASVYLFNVNTRLNQTLKITSDNNESSYGSSVAKFSNHILVGAPQEDINDTDQGAVYLYEVDDNKTNVISKTKINMQTLPPHALFGHAVALDESVVIVSARGAGLSYRYPGKVFIYSRELNGTLSLNQTFEALNSQIIDYFGESLALNSEYLLVGSPQHSFENKAYVGATYLYKRETNTTMTLVDTLTPNDSTYSQYFGNSVAIDGKYIVVGAPGVKDVYVYKISLSEDHADKLVTLHNEDAHWFGRVVSIKGKDIVIGTSAYSEMIYHYTIKDDDTVVLTEAIIDRKQPLLTSNNHSLAIGDDFFISSAPELDVNATNTGAISLFIKE